MSTGQALALLALQNEQALQRTLEGFMKSLAWEAILLFLKASTNRTIHALEWRDPTGRIRTIFIDEGGFKLKMKDAYGWEAYEAGSTSSITILSTSAQVLEEFRICDPSIPESELVENILQAAENLRETVAILG